jgi:hypothetical protein
MVVLFIGLMRRVISILQFLINKGAYPNETYRFLRGNFKSIYITNDPL